MFVSLYVSPSLICVSLWKFCFSLCLSLSYLCVSMKYLFLFMSPSLICVSLLDVCFYVSLSYMYLSLRCWFLFVSINYMPAYACLYLCLPLFSKCLSYISLSSKKMCLLSACLSFNYTMSLFPWLSMCLLTVSNSIWLYLGLCLSVLSFRSSDSCLLNVFDHPFILFGFSSLSVSFFLLMFVSTFSVLPKSVDVYLYFFFRSFTRFSSSINFFSL
jgi:hypothetical protein